MGRTVTATLRPDPRLVVSVTPQPGEGIGELIFRAASANFYESPTDVLRVGGWGDLLTKTMGAASAADRDRLAAVFGPSAGQVSNAEIWPVPTDGRPGFINFFRHVTPLNTR